MSTNTISIDLAKNVFQVIGFSDEHKITFNKRINRNALSELLATHTACNVVMEACYSSHYWGRKCEFFNHNVKLIPPQHVTPFVRGNKNDTNDAIAIYEASRRLHIRPVPIKSIHQQEILSLHRVRERLIKNRTALFNQISGLFIDFGITMSPSQVGFKAMLHIHKNSDTLPTKMLFILKGAQEEYLLFNKRIDEIEALLREFVTSDPAAKILQSIPGIGLINASAFSAAIDKGQAFKHAKDFGAWLGLTPRQYASGDTSRMGRITKRGNPYLRKQLIHGARAIVSRAATKNDALSAWINQLRERKSFNITVVATAHKLARLMWVLLKKQETYQPQSVKEVLG